MNISRWLRRNTLIAALSQTLIWVSRMVLQRKYGGPPAWLKRRFLINLLGEFNAQHFVETGTYFGQTSKLIANRFPELLIDTIEINPQLYLDAKTLLSPHFPRIKVWNGDSKDKLAAVLDSRKCARILFWLDGHNSNGFTSSGKTETPLLDELQIIGSYFAHTGESFLIVIDDLHEISTNPQYPTWLEIESFASQNLCEVQTLWNSIIITKK